tara:strand:- start:3244 stop:4707 length:1464 start_codon:yes stop_codon:yes gene_type:complete
MGLLDNFSFEKAKTNLLGTTPEEQSKALSNISSALRRSTRKGESAFGNVSQAILGGKSERDIATKNSSLEVKKAARDRANDFLALMPTGKNLTDLSQEDQLKVKTYIESEGGDYSSLFNLDWAEGATPEAPKTVTGFSDSGAKQTFQWDAAKKDWTAIGGAEVSADVSASLSKFGKIAVDLGLAPGTTEFATKVQELLTADNAGAGGGAGTSNAQDSIELEKKRVGFLAEVEAGTMTETQMNNRMAIERSIFGGGTDPGRTASANSNDERLNANFDKYDAENSSATSTLPAIAQSLAIIDSGVYTGTMGEMASDFTKVLVSLGVAPPEANVGAEQFRVNSMKSVMDWIALTKGAISEAEMGAFAAASPGLSRTREGNRMILTTAKEVAQWSQRRASAYDDLYDRFSKGGSVIPNARNLNKELKKWEEKNILQLPTPAEVAAAQKGKQLSNAAVVLNSGSPLTAAARAANITAQDWSNMPDADKALFQ